jgi:Polo-like Kinase 4 Polo Box 1
VRHRTKNVVLSILDSGEVALEFLKRERVVEVCRISSDGSRVGVYNLFGKIKNLTLLLRRL